MKKASRKVKKDVVQVNLNELATLVEKAVKDAKHDPYVDPQKHDDREEAMRKSMRESKARYEKLVFEYQNNCPHLQGCTAVSERSLKTTSIVWHGLDRDRDIIGICTNCQRIFRPLDADYEFWFNKPSGNSMSSGGNGKTEHRHLHHGVSSYSEPTGSSLDKLSDAEVSKLYKDSINLFKEMKPVLRVDKVLGREK